MGSEKISVIRSMASINWMINFFQAAQKNYSHQFSVTTVGVQIFLIAQSSNQRWIIFFPVV